MDTFLRGFITLALLISVSFADDYSLKWKYSLKKDEQKKILVKYEGEKKLFTFRWTLFINDMLTVHRSYNGNKAQNTLWNNYKNRSFRVLIKPQASDYEVPYILVKFKEFDTKKHQAIFELFLYEGNTKVWLEDLNKKNG